MRNNAVLTPQDHRRAHLISVPESSPLRINADMGRRFNVQLSLATNTLEITNPRSGRYLTVMVKQPNVGGSALLPGSMIVGTTDFNLDPTAGGVTIFGLLYDDTVSLWRYVRLGGSVGTGSLTNLTMPAEFSVATPTTTPVVTWATQTANKVFAGPASGGAAVPGFRSLVDADMPSNVQTRVYYWAHSAPTATTNISSIRVPWACTVTRLGSIIGGGTSATFNVEIRTTIDSAGTNILSADQVSDQTGEETTSSFNATAIAAGNWLYVDFSAISAAPTEWSAWVQVTVP